MKTIIHKSETRGHASHGWLEANHSFSFGGYHHPERNHFGALRVLNDDKIAPSMGFGKHPHNNMEIITIPLEGILQHKDSMGNVSQIKAGEVQVMSAGTGIYHSEHNKSQTEDLKLLQIWIIPNQRNVVPRYGEMEYDLSSNLNQLIQIVSPNETDEGLWIHQNAWFHLGQFDNDFSFIYSLKDKKNGVYLFVIEGSFDLDSIELHKRDGLAISETDELKIKSTSNQSKILLIEVPLSF
jgi:quercetin 2,3-dioxygenase